MMKPMLFFATIAGSVTGTFTFQTIVSSEHLKQATEVFQRYQKELPEFDAKLT